MININNSLLVLILVLIIVTAVLPPSYGQVSIFVSTDKKFYNGGDRITVYGTVSGYTQNIPVSIIIKNPTGNVIDISQENVRNDMTFSTTIKTGGGLWTSFGTYTVETHYSSKNFMATTTFEYDRTSPSPNTTATPFGGSYATDQTITLTSDRTSTIYYTTDGSDPTDSSPHGPSPITGISVTSTTILKYFAIDAEGNRESIKRQDYTVTIPPTTTADPSAGSYATDQTITLTSDRTSTIYYTTDGSDPTDSSPHGPSPITGISVTSDTVLKFYAVDTSGQKEEIRTEIYQVKKPIPVDVILTVSIAAVAVVGGTIAVMIIPKPIPHPNIPPNATLTIRGPNVRVEIIRR